MAYLKFIATENEKFIVIEGDGAGIIVETEVGQHCTLGAEIIGVYKTHAEAMNHVAPLSKNRFLPLPEEGQKVEQGYYTDGDNVVYCRQAHVRTGHDPSEVPALFYFYRENPEGMEWIEQEMVSIGNTRTWLGITYECIQAHVTLEGWEPPNVPALWQVVTSGVPDWVQPTGAQDAYNIGDHVMFNGVEYESVINANVWSPAVYPAGWAVV